MPAENIFNEPAIRPIRQPEFINEPFLKIGRSWGKAEKSLKSLTTLKTLRTLKFVFPPLHYLYDCVV